MQSVAQHGESKDGKTPVSRSPREYALVVLALMVYLVLATFVAEARKPWSDEGDLACPGWNLAVNGYMGTTVVPPGFLPGIARHTYYVMPLGIAVQATAYKVFGFSLITMRMVSVFAGMIAVFAWFLIVRYVSGSKPIAYLASLILMTDYIFVTGAAWGRLDMICMAFGSSGLAAYLLLRERSLGWALFAANLAIAASGLTHPLGFLYLCGLCVLVVYYDRQRIFQWSVLGGVAVPYLIAAGCWSIYILQDPVSFLAQFRYGMGAGGRMSTWQSPFSALWAEITERYARAFGLREHDPGNAGPIFLKALVLLAYIAGVVGSLAVPRIRKSRAFPPLAGVTATFFIVMMMIEGQRLTIYLVHMIPLYAALLALFLYWIYQARILPPWLLAAGVMCLLVLQAGGAAMRGRQDYYHRNYLPAMQFVVSHAGKGQLIMGGPELGFGIGYNRALLRDNSFGLKSGRVPDWIVLDEYYSFTAREMRLNEPAAYAYAQSVLSGYQKVYEYNGFKVYKRPAVPAESRGNAMIR